MTRRDVTLSALKRTLFEQRPVSNGAMRNTHMADGKNQHFVPQFYLRYFSCADSNKLVCTFHLPSGRYAPHAKIRDHACDDYFYGKDGVEEALQKFESTVAPTIAGIIASERLPEWQSQEHKDLALFVTLQRGRTAEAAAKGNEVMEKMMQALATQGVQSLPDRTKDVGTIAGFDSTPRMLLHMAVTHLCAALDLRYRLVRNNTSRPFITSDHPVVAYNQFYEANVPGFSDTGLQSRGLQLFFPLSPRYLLILYDSDVYKIGGRAYEIIHVDAVKADVEALNVLQTVNAGESLFFSDAADEGYIRSIVAKAEANKKSEKGKADVLPAEQFGLPYGKILAGHEVNARIGLRLSFIGRQPSASRFASLVGGQRLRNPELVDRLSRPTYRRRTMP